MKFACSSVPISGPICPGYRLNAVVESHLALLKSRRRLASFVGFGCILLHPHSRVCELRAFNRQTRCKFCNDVTEKGRLLRRG